MQINRTLLSLALLALGPCALAQQVPGAGIQLQQLTPPVAPISNEPRIVIKQVAAPVTSGAESAQVRVDRLQFSGAPVGSDAELLAITEFKPGSDLTLAQLQAMAQRITQHYRAQGFFVANAYIPAQDISSHVVTIAVSVGQYGEIKLHNTSRLHDSVANRQLSGLHSGDPIKLEPLEDHLLLLSDVPGVVTTSSLVPGTTPGTSDLLVDVAPGRAVTGEVDADNDGNPYTGEYRLGATVNFNNPLGLGDVASVRGVTSGSGLNYGRAAYQIPFGRVTAGVAYSHLDYELGRQFKALDAHGTANVASVFAFMPLIRSRRSNLYVGLAYDDKNLDDRIDLTPFADRRAHVGVITASLYGNHQDNIGGGGLNTFYVALSTGKLDIQTPSARLADAATAKANGSYSKVWFNVTRLQQIAGPFSLYGSLTGQWASKNLDPSEKFVLGGMDGIRAYRQGEAYGDQGYLADLEARLDLVSLSSRVPGDVQLIGFVDRGSIDINKDPWFSGRNTRSIGSYGIGATWVDPGNFALRMYYAFRMGSDKDLSTPDESGRFSIQAIKYF